MRHGQILPGNVLVLGLAFLFALGASSCQQAKIGKRYKVGNTYAVAVLCGDQTVQVNPDTGAEPQVVFLCRDSTVTWNANGHTFSVEFENGSPFSDDGKQFNNGHPRSAGAKYFRETVVFKYRITVDGTHTFDPQVVPIGGGGS